NAYRPLHSMRGSTGSAPYHFLRFPTPLSSFPLKPPPCHIESMPRRTQVSRFDCHSKSTSASLLCPSLNGCAALSRAWPISQTRRPCHDPAPLDRPDFSVRTAG